MRIPHDVHRVARGQDGLVTRTQALDHGMTVAAVRHALGHGAAWQRVLRGIYATFTGELRPRHLVRAALLRAGPEAAVSGTFACRSYGLRYVPAGPLVVVVPAQVQRSCSPAALTFRVQTMPQVRNVRGVRVVEPDRAVIDACRSTTSLRDARALLCESVQSGLSTPGGIADVLGDARWKGSGLMRRALRDTNAGCRATPECELRDLILASTVLAEPRWNQPLPGNASSPLIPDACWPDAGVVVEVDSVEWHRLGDAPEATERRRSRYAALGWTVVPISPRRLREEPAAVLAQIEQAVRAGLDARVA